MKHTVDGKEVGATTVATIVEGENSFSGQTKEELRKQWVAIKQGVVPSPQEPTKAMKRGLWLEPFVKLQSYNLIREAMREGTNLEIIDVNGADRIVEERLGCSCDSKFKVDKDLIIPNPMGNDFPMRSLIINEFKTDAQSKSTVPPIMRYEWQLQTQMAVTGARFGIISKMGNDLNVKLYPYKRSEKMIAIIMSKVREFWYKVDKDIPYEEDNEQPPVINLDDHAFARQMEVMLDSRMTAKAEATKWKDSLETIDAQIQGVMQKLNSERATFKNYLIEHKTVNVSAKPEQMMPAKPARSHKRFSIREI
mgnify:FL=1